MIIFEFTSIFVTSIIAFALGLVVLLKNTKANVGITFFAITLFASLWATFSYLSSYATTIDLAIFFNNMAYLWAYLAVLSFVIFSLFFPKKQKLTPRTLKILIPGAIFFGLFSMSPQVVGRYSLSDSGLVYNYGVWLPLFLVLLIALMCIAAFNLSKVANIHHTRESIQARIILDGFSFCVIFGVICVGVIPLFNESWHSIPFIPPILLLMIGVIAYTILRHGLFDIKPLIARSLVYVFSVIFIISLFMSVIFILSSVLLGDQITIQATIFFAILSVIVAFIFQPVRRFFDQISNDYFYRDAYDPQYVLNTINSTLASTLDLNSLLFTTAKVITDNLKLSYCNFFVADMNIIGTNPKKINVKEIEELIRITDKMPKKTFTVYDEQSDNTVSFMRSLDVDIIIKMIATGQKVGNIIIGHKKSGNEFSAQDMQLLEIISDEVAVAVQNVLRYEEIAHFNATLRGEVDAATGELRRSNKKLKALDAAKDEFISMASHQLRTPLTVVNGNLSMVLEENTDNLRDIQKNLLNQAFMSSQRMAYLIADLLNVSRVQTGKFVIEPKPTYLPDVAASEIAQLTETIKAKGLTLKFIAPKDFPVLNLDETKTRQVIMNFIDNAIYYSPRGGTITVRLTANKESVEYTVTDEGIGVPKYDQHNLFTKFYRATNARKTRPDGTGLGLFLAKKVIVSEGGAIIFKSTEGKGSTFGFSFPRTKLETALPT